MALAIARTLPLRHLLSRIGSSTYRFNTVLVGLDCVANGGGDGGSIAVTWTKPKIPAQAKSAAAQARSFACAGAIVLAADVFDSYLRDIAQEDWLKFPLDTIQIATKSKTRPKEDGGAYSVAERVKAIIDDLNITDVESVALIELFSKWRNVVAHGAERRPSIEPTMRRLLIEKKEIIAKGHAHLRVELALKNFEARAIPVPKEVTSLIANSVRLARSIDQAAIRRVAASNDQVETAVKSLLQQYFQRRGISIARAFVADAWQGDRERRIAVLVKLLGSLGISNSSEPVSATLRTTFVNDLAALSRDEFETRFFLGVPGIDRMMG